MLRYVLFVVLILCSSCKSFSGNESSIKLCRFRNMPLYPPDVFNYVVGANCYYYITEDWLNNNYKYEFYPVEVTGEDGKIYKNIPVIIFENKTMLFFNYTNPESMQQVRVLYKNDKYYKKWEDCAIAAMYCCLNIMDETNIYPTDLYPCPHVWDSYTCYPRAVALTTPSEPCPLHLIDGYSIDVCQLESEKQCFQSGWNQITNYAICDQAIKYKERYKFHLIVLYVAVGIMFPSIIILLFFRNLRILRIALHRNVIISIFIKNILVIISKSLVILDAIDKNSNNVMLDNGIPCRILAYFENASKNAIFTCMLVDAFYLHKLIVRSFKDDPKIWQIYLFVVVGSLTPTIIWSGFMIFENDNNCWMVDKKGYQWITDGYKYATLAINCILLIDILRILCFKFGKKSTNKTQTKTALKATLILLPIFGVPLIITSQRYLLDSRDCVASDVYNCIIYIIEGLQGILLSVFFCYLSAEVHNEIFKKYEKIDRYIRDKFGLNQRRRTVGRRRTTGLTNISGRF